MRRAAGALVLAGLASTFLMTTAGPAGAASAQGCSGSGRSIAESGGVIDRASAPGSGGTEDDPFTVETKGKISYDYAVEQGALSGGTWTATIDTGSPIPGTEEISFSGDIDPGSSESGSGVEPLEDHLNIGGLAALVGKMEITITGRAGGVNCTVVGWLEITDSPVKSVMFIEAFILFILAILLFWLAMASGGSTMEAEMMLDAALSDEGKKS